MNAIQYERVRSGRGFFAALDQSGGSTPGALAEYGIGKDRYSSDAEMFSLVRSGRRPAAYCPAQETALSGTGQRKPMLYWRTL